MIVIDDKQYTEVASIMGYPKVPLVFERQWVIENVFEPALREYYKWIPIREETTYPLGIGEFKIDFPDENTYGLLDARPFIYAQTTYRGSPFAMALNTLSIGNANSMGGMGKNVQANLYKDVYYNSIRNYKRAVKVRANKIGKFIYGNVNEPIRLFVVWAKKSNDWNNIEFNQHNNLVRYAQSILLLKQWGLRGQVEISSDVQLNNSMLKDMADEYKEEVLTTWKELSKVVAIKG